MLFGALVKRAVFGFNSNGTANMVNGFLKRCPCPITWFLMANQVVWPEQWKVGMILSTQGLINQWRHEVALEVTPALASSLRYTILSGSHWWALCPRLFLAALIDRPLKSTLASHSMAALFLRSVLFKLAIRRGVRGRLYYPIWRRLQPQQNLLLFDSKEK